MLLRKPEREVRHFLKIPCMTRNTGGAVATCESRGIRHIAHGRPLLVGRSYNICTPVLRIGSRIQGFLILSEVSYVYAHAYELPIESMA